MRDAIASGAGSIWDLVKSKIPKLLHYNYFRAHLAYFLIISIIGGLALWIMESDHDLNWIDAYYTSVSALCVTGLSITDFSAFHLSSQIVTLVLIVVGGGVFTSLFPVIIRRYYYRQLYKNTRLGLNQTTPVLTAQKEPEHRGSLHVVPHALKVEDNIEYLALGELMWVIITYIVGLCVVSTAVLTLYFYAYDNMRNMWEKRTKAGSLSPFYGALFHCVSAFNNAGFSPLSDNLIYFEHDRLVLLTLAFLIAAGNTAYPMLLRFAVWLKSRFVGPKRQQVFQYLLDYPRRCSGWLFPSKQTWTLVVVWFAINFVATAAFSAIEVNMKELGNQRFDYVVVRGM